MKFQFRNKTKQQDKQKLGAAWLCEYEGNITCTMLHLTENCNSENFYIIDFFEKLFFTSLNVKDRNFIIQVA